MPSNSVKEILAATTEPRLQNVNLTNCDREPIHIPNLIQPHGVLLAVSRAEWTIVQISLNTEQMLGVKPENLLGCPLTKLLGVEQTTIIQTSLNEDLEPSNPIPIEIVRDEAILAFNGIVHCDGEIIIVELETPANKDVLANREVELEKRSPQNLDFFDFYSLVKKPIAKIQKADNLDQMCNEIVKQVKQVTGFDRVMVYRFNAEGSGTVVAESVREGLEPYLGLHYPATDIPKQARLLYILNGLRLIPDVAYEPVGLTPQLNPLTNQPLNLSMSVLRSVSPLHIEYLNNMGVAASMSISLIQNKKLWGLIACHHNTPKKVPYEIRTACEFIAQIVAFELAAKESDRDAEYKMKLKTIQSQLVASISQAEELETALTQNPFHLLDLVGAGGVALSFGNNITLLGDTPSESAIEAMLPWLENQFEEEIIYETTSLAQVYRAAVEDKEVASGLLALAISKVQKSFIIWFRPEVIQTVDWAGDPHKPQEIAEDGTITLSPRTSFAKWQETVKLKSLPWKACQVEAALELRSSIVGIVLRKADELAQVNKELTRSNIELDSFAYIASHDLKEPLRGIYNYSSFLLEDYGETLDEEGVEKLHTLMRLTHRMEDLVNSLLHYSRLGRAELKLLPVDLNELVAGVFNVLEASQRDRQVKFVISRPLPIIRCDRSQVDELFTNLISNGIKYNQKTEKIIEIGYLDPDDPVAQQKLQEHPDDYVAPTIFYVRDNGIGIRDKHRNTIFRIFKRLHGQKKYGGGTGAGLTIARKIVERHGGEIWLQSIYGEGSTFYFTLE